MKNKSKEKKIGFAGKMSSFFLKNREFSVLTIIVLFSWGILSFLMMPKQYNPQIVAPAFNITTQFPGATSQEVYEFITRPMEDKISEIPTVDEIMSESKEGGVSMVTVKFFIGEDLENAKITLAQKLRDNITFKPMGAKDPIIQTIDPDDIPIITLGITSETLSQESLRKVAFDLADKLKLVENTSKIEIKGGKTKQLSIKLDIEKLNTYEISALEAMESIKNNNSLVIAGKIKEEKNSFEVKVDGRINSPEEASDIFITKKQGTPVYLSDIAEIDYDSGDIENHLRFTKEDQESSAVYLAISKLKGSNSMTVADNVIERLEIINRESPLPEVQIDILRNNGQVANEEVFGLTKNLFISIGVVSLVLLLFLSFRSSLIVAISIPLTLAAVFGVGNFFDQTVNRITLFALILSLGLLIDSATVVIENIWRLLRENPKEKKRDLIIRAVDEVGPGLLMSTITTILAFYPMAFVGGMMGPYMGPIPFFVPVALVASLLIAYSINPFLADSLIGEKQLNKSQQGSIFVRKINIVRGKYKIFITKILNNPKLRKKILISVFSILLIVLTLPAFKVVKFRMLPKADRQQFYVYLDLPANASLKKTNSVARSVEEILLKDSEIQSIQSFVGESQVVDFNGLFKGSGSRIEDNQATLKVNLTHPDERKIPSEEIVLRMRPKTDDFLKRQPDARIKFIEDPPGPPVLSTVLLKVQGDNEERLASIALDIEKALSETEEVVDIDNSLEESGLEYVFKIDSEKASLFGLSSQQITQVLQMHLNGIPVGLYHEMSSTRIPEQELIVIRLKKEDRDNFSDLQKIQITNKSGQKVPLSEVAQRIDSSIPSTIHSSERRKTTYVTAEMGKRSSTYAMIDMLMFLLDYKLENENAEVSSWSLFGVNYRDIQTGEVFSINIDGEWKLTLEVFRDLGIAMGVAIFLIYFVLVAQFKSLRIPLLVMGTIPLALIGVLPGFALLGATKGVFFNATSMIGVIALSGIVVNNAIILLEYLNSLKRKGYEIKEALIEAGETRFLPIILTSVTTILGSLTIISDPVWEGLAWSIIWGLSLSAVLTLIIFPLLYYTFERKNWESKK